MTPTRAPTVRDRLNQRNPRVSLNPRGVTLDPVEGRLLFSVAQQAARRSLVKLPLRQEPTRAACHGRIESRRREKEERGGMRRGRGGDGGREKKKKKKKGRTFHSRRPEERS